MTCTLTETNLNLKLLGDTDTHTPTQTHTNTRTRTHVEEGVYMLIQRCGLNPVSPSEIRLGDVTKIDGHHATHPTPKMVLHVCGFVSVCVYVCVCLCVFVSK